MKNYTPESVNRCSADAGEFFLYRLVHHTRGGMVFHTAKDVGNDSLLQGIPLLFHLILRPY